MERRKQHRGDAARSRWPRDRAETRNPSQCEHSRKWCTRLKRQGHGVAHQLRQIKLPGHGLRRSRSRRENDQFELQGLDEQSITHGDLDVALFQELLAGKRNRYTIDKRYFHKSGAEVWGRVTVTMVREPAGDFVIAVVEDITEKRGVEEAADEVRRAHERYALVARATNDVIWDWDAEHGTIIWNDALQTMFGYAPDQLDNRLQWWDSHLHPDDRERVVSGINRIIEKGGSSWTDEYRFERADGSFTERLGRGYIARSEDGTPIRMIGAMLDVTERKRAERIPTLMAEASAILASSLEYHTTLARVAELSLPLPADSRALHLRTRHD